MSNWFADIGQASSGLNAARYGLTVVSQNISNASTEGYTRQVSRQAAVDGSAVTGIQTARVGLSQLGGVTVTSTDRMTDPVLDVRVRAEHANGALADTSASQLATIEQVFPEPSDNGLSSQLNSFWTAWGSVAIDPGSSAARTVLLKQATAVTSTLKSMSASLSDITNNTVQYLGTDIATANSAASQLASVNGSIAVTAATGGNVNSLLDQRDQLLDSLSKLVGGSVTINANGSADVSVGGQSLVSGVTTSALTTDASNQVSVGGTAVAVANGSVAARLTALNTTLPGYQASLDAVADSLSSVANTIQAAGYDLAGNAGTALFSGNGAAGISVSISDPSGIAASSTPGGNLDGTNAINASKQGTVAGGPDVTYNALVGDVASASALSQQQQATQDAVVTSVDSLHASIAGVSYDEEVSNMLTYQHAFSASSRVLTTLDDMLDTLINHTGLVGKA
jgi:flagellar hook-associated protein 1 FlgK